MIVSLDEIETRCRRAALGAGFAIGLSEEAGKAARGLAENGIAFEAAVLSAFSAPRPKHPPRFDGRILRPADAGEALCPILAGAFLSDLGARDVELVNVRAPVLLGPFFRAAKAPVKLCWDRVIVSVRGRLIMSDGALEAGADAVVPRVAVTPGIETPGHLERHEYQGVTVDDAAWERLLALEIKTYVPASDVSKAAGAGTGALTEND